MTLFWSCVLGQKGQVSVFFSPVQGAGKLAASSKTALIPPEPDMELACAPDGSQPVVRASLANVRGHRRKSKGASSSLSSSSPAFLSGYKLPGAAKAKCLQHHSSSAALCIKKDAQTPPTSLLLTPLPRSLSLEMNNSATPGPLLSVCFGLRL